MTKEFFHIPVLKNELLSFFHKSQDKIFVDATAGKGGHLQELVKVVGPQNTIYAFDRDERAHRPDAAMGVALTYPDSIKLLKKPFSHISSFFEEKNQMIDGLICDLGVSSEQLQDPVRGFSINYDGPLDMRMDNSKGLTAYDWLLKVSEKDLADTLFLYGDERKSRQIARLIKKSWPIQNSTFALRDLILKALRPKKWSKTHPATRSFQAIRIAVNDEMEELQTLLREVPKLLNPKGVMAIITFHSIEDRMVKMRFKELQIQGGFKIQTKKPIIPSLEEIKNNPRSRSAKLRVIQREAQ